MRARAGLSMALVVRLLLAPHDARAGGPPSVDRQALFRALVKAHELDPDRQLVHLTHVCNLKIGGQWFPVADVRELVPSASAPRGVNRIVVLDRRLVPVRKVEYTNEVPLFCLEEKLYVFGDLAIDGLEPAGNVLVFSDGGRQVAAEQLDFSQIPLKTNGAGKHPPQ